MQQQETPAERAAWLIWSNEHRAWWRSERCGYTCAEDEAGRYTLSEASLICRDGGQPRSWSRDTGPYEMMVLAPEFVAGLNAMITLSAVDSVELSKEAAATLTERDAHVTRGGWTPGHDNGVHSVPNLQQRVAPWMQACFGPAIAADKIERRNRALEEALELDQAAGGSREDAHMLVDYVHDRPAGDIAQEVGGVMLTLAAFCLAHGLDMQTAGEAELARVWTKIDQIRAKQAAKPRNSPLPAAPAAQRYSQAEMLAFGDFCKQRGGWWSHTPEQLFALFQEKQQALLQQIETSGDTELCVGCQRPIAENEQGYHYRDGPVACRDCAPTLAEAIVELQESIDCSEDDEDKAAWRESIAALQARIDAGEDPATKHVW